MQHSNEFITLCQTTKAHIQEVSIEETERLLSADLPPLLIDVREADEFAAGHLPKATHLSKGWIEAKIHHLTSNKNTPLLLYCGGGNRSALAAENLQKMGYTQVMSMIGGFRAWQQANKLVISPKTPKALISDTGYDYILNHSLQEPAILKALRDSLQGHPNYNMMSAPDEVQLLTVLAQLINAQQVIEVGTFVGYTALALALALPPQANIITCDVNTEFTALGKPFWEQAKVADKIDLRIAPAIETLQHLIAAGKSNQFDLIYIDADKQNYSAYFECALQLVRPNGLIAIDNTLGVGTQSTVFSSPVLPRHEASIASIKRFNEQLACDQRVSISMLPIAYGLTLARKK